MSFNLAEAAKGLISNELISKASTFLGESESGVSKALSGILPVVLGGLVDKSSTAAGAATVAALAAEQYKTGILDTAGSFFGNDSASHLSKGAGLVNTIFGENVSGLSGLLSNFSGIKTTSAGSLFGLITPIVLAFLGKNASTNNLNAAGLASMLSSQKENISMAVPAGLSVPNIFGDAPVAHAAQAHVPHFTHEEESTEATGGSLKLLLPLLLLILVAAAAWYLYSGHAEKTTAHVEGTNSMEKEKVPVAAATATGKVDTSGNYIYELGKMVTIELPNAAGTLTVGEYSTENKLYHFLNDSTAKIDTVKGNWFEFTNVRFKTGGTQIDSLSEGQLKNIVAISKAFPKAQFKLGGYTDNTGDAAFNVSLSQKRSDAVVVALKKLGASSAAITGAKGYGPQFPIGDNGTAEGKAMNRRVAINVKSK